MQRGGSSKALVRGTAGSAETEGIVMDSNSQTLAQEGIRRVHNLWFDEEEDTFTIPKITKALEFLGQLLPTQYAHLFGLWQAYLSTELCRLAQYRWRLFSEALDQANKDLPAISERRS